MNSEIMIKGRAIGSGHPAYVIAEAGVNHNGCYERAQKMIDAACQAGADAIKFQTFSAEKLVTRQAPKAEYQKEHTGESESQFDMLKRLELSREAHYELKLYCENRNIEFLSTPFDEDSAHFLDNLGVAAYKISSGEINNFPFLETVARKGKPIILSTGMANLGEVEDAVRVIRNLSVAGLVLLHCVSSYPADPKEVNLRAMNTLAAAFQSPVGFSDHTLGIEVSLGAVTLGACVIEKHFTLDKNLPGPDHRASSEPAELAALVLGIRKIESSLGHGQKVPSAAEVATAKVARKSVVAACAIPSGSILLGEMLVVKRPGTGLPPFWLQHLVGRQTRRDIDAGELLSLEMLQ